MHYADDHSRVVFTNDHPLSGRSAIVMESKGNGAYVHALLDPPYITGDGQPVDAVWVFSQLLMPEDDYVPASLSI